MFDLLKLKKEVSETTADIEPDDVLSVKQKLKGLGYYEEPEWGMSKFSDNQMFDGIRKFQKDHKLKIDGIMKPEGETQNTINYKYKSAPISQVTGALSDMYKNYKQMRNDNVIGNDDYFHCKANFDATQRGTWGEKTAEYIGDAKERFDYFKNRFKGISPIDSYDDYNHDKYINYLGRQQAANGLYSNSKDGCNFKRKSKTNEHY